MNAEATPQTETPRPSNGHLVRIAGEVISLIELCPEIPETVSAAAHASVLRDHLRKPELAPTYPISGARVLNAREVALMNRIKEYGETLSTLVDEVRQFQADEINNFNYQFASVAEREEQARLTIQGQHWRMRAVDDLQDGLMKLGRSVARPSKFA